MSFRKLLNKTCTIQTKSNDFVTNADGTIIETWADTYTNISCRLDKIRSSYVDEMIGQNPESTHILFLLSDQTVSRGNRVVIDNLTYIVTDVDDPTGKNHHIECELKLLEI